MNPNQNYNSIGLPSTWAQSCMGSISLLLLLLLLEQKFVCEGLSKISSYFTLHLIQVEKLKRFKKVSSDLQGRIWGSAQGGPAPTSPVVREFFFLNISALHVNYGIQAFAKFRRPKCTLDCTSENFNHKNFPGGACAQNSIILIYFAINQKYNNSIQKYTKDNTEYSN